MKVVAGKFGKQSLTNKNFLASGGQASVYKVGNHAYKIFMDFNTKKPNPTAMIPEKKIIELMQIKASNVLKPLDVVYDTHSDVIGYVMDFVPDSYPFSKLITKSFKKKNNFGIVESTHLLEEIQKTILSIHAAECLAPDINELNILVSKDFKTPYFIDADSYQTKSFKATAIMESIRDRSLPFGSFNFFCSYCFSIIYKHTSL
jgi:DNA-binding helix-hairpin-helix protein with protein kinase domain